MFVLKVHVTNVMVIINGKDLSTVILINKDAFLLITDVLGYYLYVT